MSTKAATKVHKCAWCSRLYATDKTLKQHHLSCQKKKAEEDAKEAEEDRQYEAKISQLAEQVEFAKKLDEMHVSELKAQVTALVAQMATVAEENAILKDKLQRIAQLAQL